MVAVMVVGCAWHREARWASETAPSIAAEGRVYVCVYVRALCEFSYLRGFFRINVIQRGICQGKRGPRGNRHQLQAGHMQHAVACHSAVQNAGGWTDAHDHDAVVDQAREIEFERLIANDAERGLHRRHGYKLIG